MLFVNVTHTHMKSVLSVQVLSLIARLVIFIDSYLYRRSVIQI